MLWSYLHMSTWLWEKRHLRRVCPCYPGHPLPRHPADTVALRGSLCRGADPKIGTEKGDSLGVKKLSLQKVELRIKKGLGAVEKGDGGVQGEKDEEMAISKVLDL